MASLDREELLADRTLVGPVFCRAYARRVDEWLQELFEDRLGAEKGLSLVATGGYGRSVLCPESDLDVMLLHNGWSEEVLAGAAELMWFPVWDAHLDLGHSVRTVAQSIELARSDLDTATSLLSLRHLAGDPELSDDLAEQSSRAWRANARKWVPEIIDGARSREIEAGEVAFLLEPDLKYSSGGLRDLHAIDWLEAAEVDVLTQERRDLRAAHEVLLAARVELHRSAGRKGDRLLLEEQDAVAEALDYDDADLLMSDIAAASRTIDWIRGAVFQRARQRVRRFRRLRERKPKIVAADIELADGVVRIVDRAPVGNDPALLLRLAVAAVEHQAHIDRDSLDRLVELGPAVPVPWPTPVLDNFVQLLLLGGRAIPVIETLDHVGLFVRLLPEWEPTRSKVQRNQYHRFTVDRHLLEACANAAELVDRVERPDLLVLGALLHDIGKGYPGDHTEVGVELIQAMGPNMGIAPDDVDTLARLCEHHLLLPDVATRRDIEDVGTIRSVAEQVETSSFLHLLAALTEADSIATGPSAWSSWKKHLIAELSWSVDRWLADGGTAAVERSFPDERQVALLRDHEHLVVGEGDTLTVVTTDRPGLFARVAGAVALSNRNIIDAQTYVDGQRALEVVRIDVDEEPVDWPELIALVEEIVSGDEDLRPRFAHRSASMLIQPRQGPLAIVPVNVEFDNDISDTATVIEVGGPDRIGLLYELSKVLIDAGLDQQQARVQTIGGDVVDAFYVTHLDGSKVTDPTEQDNLRAALLAVLEPDVTDRS